MADRDSLTPLPSLEENGLASRDIAPSTQPEAIDSAPPALTQAEEALSPTRRQSERQKKKTEKNKANLKEPLANAKPAALESDGKEAGRGRGRGRGKGGGGGRKVKGDKGAPYLSTLLRQFN